MKRQIIVTIDCDDERCNECDGVWLSGYDAECSEQDFVFNSRRGPLCLAAERKLVALIEAGQEMQNQIQDHGLLVFPDNAWDRAVKEVRGE